MSFGTTRCKMCASAPLLRWGTTGSTGIERTKMTVTQADVARLAGVSRKTVSNVVNRYPHVSRDLVRRVDRAISELSYRPNHAARSLRTGQTRTIQLVVPELDVPYFAELARWVVTEAESVDLSVLIRQTFGDRERERRAIEGEFGDYADGTILSPVASDLESILRRRTTTPIVLVGELYGDGELPHIGIDNEEAAFRATRHLVERGRERIAFIGAQHSQLSHMARMRRSGWERGLQAAGRVAEEVLVRYTAAYHRADGAAAMRGLLESANPPDGVFCATDLLALGAMRAAYELGRTVPDDLAVVGVDDIDESRYSIPSLTTIAPDKQWIAKRSVSRLAALMSEPADSADQEELQAAPEELVPFTLALRESTA